MLLALTNECYELLMSCQWFGPGPALLWRSAWDQQAQGRHVWASPATGYHAVLPHLPAFKCLWHCPGCGSSSSQVSRVDLWTVSCSSPSLFNPSFFRARRMIYQVISFTAGRVKHWLVNEGKCFSESSMGEEPSASVIRTLGYCWKSKYRG